MNLRYWHVAIIALIIPFLVQADELEDQNAVISPQFEKIYVTPDQILLTQEGIFYLTPLGSVSPVRILASDLQGIYIIGEVYRCPGCSRINRGICTNPACSMYGR